MRSITYHCSVKQLSIYLFVICIIICQSVYVFSKRTVSSSSSAAAPLTNLTILKDAHNNSTIQDMTDSSDSTVPRQTKLDAKLTDMNLQTAMVGSGLPILKHSDNQMESKKDKNQYMKKSEKSRKTYIRLSQTMQNLTRPIGTKGTFYCDILGEPIPQFQWFKNGERITEKVNKIRITTGLWGSALRVDKLQSTDAGSYICVASNPSGTLNATAFLHLTTKSRTNAVNKPHLQEDEYIMNSAIESDGFCQEFHSNVCGKYLMGHRVYVTREFQQALIEAQISKFLKLTATQSLHRVREDCLRRLMEAICYYTFPVCLPTKSGPYPNQVADMGDNILDSGNANHHQLDQTRYLCKQDCEMVTQNECGSTYDYLERKMMHELPSMIMNCAALPAYTPDNPHICRRIGEPLLVADQNPEYRPDGDREYWHENSLLNPTGGDKKIPSSEQSHESGELTAALSTGPDLLPIFVSFGALAFLGVILLIVCFLCRRGADSSPRLQADGSSLLGRSRINGACHGRLNRSKSDRYNRFQTRGQGVGAPNDSSNGKKRRVPGMGAGAKLSSTNGLLNGMHEGYTTTYSSNMAVCSVADAHTVSSPTVIGQVSISSNQHLSNVNKNIDLSVATANTLNNNNASATYFQYQTANFMTPQLPPPRAPAPLPPGVQVGIPHSQSNNGTMISQSTFQNGTNISHPIPSFIPTVGVTLNGDANHESGVQYDISVDAESPTAYTTLRNASPSGFLISEHGLSMNSFNGCQTNNSTNTNTNFSKSALDDQIMKATEYPISQLRFGKQFGQGVFGPVYKAELLPNNAYENGVPLSVIVKTLSAGSPASLQANFRREANLISELDHPNVLSLLGVSVQHPPWCMIFEIRQYMDLCELLSSRRAMVNQLNLTTKAYNNNNNGNTPHPLNDSEICRILLQVASGMEYLSSNRFVHRDLAARNVLILNDQLYCKITDLGLARDCYASDYYRLHPHSLMLPIRWMPLDSIIYGKFTVESDIWAFGVLMWEILSGGMRPYAAYSDPEVLDLIRARQLLPCPQYCSTSVYMFMTSCWNEDIERRPSFRDCLNQLQNLLCDKTYYQAEQQQQLLLPPAYSQAIEIDTDLQIMKNMNGNEHLSTTNNNNKQPNFNNFTASYNTNNINNNSNNGNNNNTNHLINGNGTNADSFFNYTKEQNQKFTLSDHFELTHHQVNNESPDGASVNRNNNNNKTIPVMYSYTPNMGSLTPTVEPQLDNCAMNGLEMRLLPNSTTMYLPTLNPVT